MMRNLLHILMRRPKLLLMTAGVLLIYLLSWQFGLRKTLNLIICYHTISHTSSYREGKESSHEGLLDRLDSLDQMMGCTDRQSDDIRQEILERLSEAGKHFPHTMVDIPKGYVYEKQGYVIMVNTFVLEGNYPNLVHLMYSMDTNRGPGRVIATRMYIHKTYQSASPELRLALYFQHLKKKT